jgi:hypothetical protein
VRQNVAVLAHPHERKITQASVPKGGPIQGSQADKRCNVQDTAEPKIKNDGGLPGAAALSGNRSELAALKREQREQYESNHREKWDTGKEGEADHRRYEMLEARKVRS